MALPDPKTTPEFPRKLAHGWESFANPECESCRGDGIVTGMGGQSRVISPCHDCWPNGQPARTAEQEESS